MKQQDGKDASARSPLAGCAILIAALLVMLFLIVFSTVTLFRQSNEIAKFTDDKPREIGLSHVDASIERDLSARLKAFQESIGRDQAARLELTVDDINLAIAAYDAFVDLRKTFRVVSITADEIRIDVSFELNGKPRMAKEGESGWLVSDARYLNARLVARPVLLKHEVVLKLEAIDVPNAQVPVEFIEQMSPYRITERYVTDAVLGPAMAKLTRVELADGKLVLARVAGEVPGDEITDQEVDHASSRFWTILGAAACVFLLFAGFVVFIGLRSKATRE